MNEQEVEQFIEECFRDGYSVQELQSALRDEGVEEKKIKQAVADLEQKLKQENINQEKQTSDKSSNRTGHKDILKKIDLSGDSYKIKQRLLFNRYHIYDTEENLVLKAKQKILRFKEEIPFMNSENEVIFRVKADRIVDMGGDYTVFDEETEDPVIMLDKKYTLFRHRWVLRDPETEELLGKVHSQNPGVELFRWLGGILPILPNIFAFVPHTYDIDDRNGNKIAALEGQFSLRDIYQLNINDSNNIPKEALISGAIAIDALEGN